jgi:hypothetical protein
LVLRLCGLMCLVMAAACGDAPTQPDRPDVAMGEGPAYNATPQGCVSGGLCTLEPIVVDGGDGSNSDCDMWWTPSCGTCMTGSISGPDDMQGLAGCTDGGSSGAGEGPGGGGTAPPPASPPPAPDDGICTAAEYGTVCEGEDRPECERKPDAPAECVTRSPNTTEWAALGQTVDRMTENTDYCRGAKALAQEMYSAGREGGRIVLWDGRNYVPGTNQQGMVWGKNYSDSRGRIIAMDSYLAFDVPSLLAHEALHAYLSSINWPGTTEEQEAWVRTRESECAG